MLWRLAGDKREVDDLRSEFVVESREGLDRMERCLTELERHPEDREPVARIFRAVHTMKGGAGFLGLGRIERLAHAGEGLLAALRDGRVLPTPEVIAGMLRLLDALRAILRLVETIGSEGKRAADDDSHLVRMVVSLCADGGAFDREDAETDESCVDLALSGDRSLRVDAEVLDWMSDLVGELVVTGNGLLGATAKPAGYGTLLRRLGGVTAELRTVVQRARMQPVGHLFAKFPRLVRDLATLCGREVRLEFCGQNTQMDKGLLETIRDPLIHAVRNAIDHGIEPPAQRIRVGKPAAGLVRLRAVRKGSCVVVEVSDDGAGIQEACLVAKAVQRGFLSADQAERLGARERLDLVFVPGLSTRDKVSSVSGRGVGLDVVKTNVEAIGGCVELESSPGQGTIVRLRLPLIPNVREEVRCER